MLVCLLPLILGSVAVFAAFGCGSFFPYQNYGRFLSDGILNSLYLRQDFGFWREDTFNIHLKSDVIGSRNFQKRKNGVTLTQPQPLIRQGDQLQLMRPRVSFLLVITTKIIRSTFILSDDRQFASRKRKEGRKRRPTKSRRGAREEKKKKIVTLVTKVTEDFSDGLA